MELASPTRLVVPVNERCSGRRASRTLVEEIMARPKRWYDPEATEALRVVPRGDRRDLLRLAPMEASTGACPAWANAWRYPLSDGPGHRAAGLLPAGALGAFAADLRFHRGARTA